MDLGTIREIMQEELGLYYQSDTASFLGNKLVFYVPKNLENLEDLLVKQRNLLQKYGIYTQVDQDDLYYLVYFKGVLKQEKPAKVPLIHIALFLVTLFTTTATGAMLRGKWFWEGWDVFLTGIPYGFSLLFILTTHELGHYITAIRHRIRATLPYYIPFFIPAFNLGTFGAFIKIKSPIPNRKVLLYVGMYGPLSGFVASLVILSIGYAMLPDWEGIKAYIETIHPYTGNVEPGTNLILGKSLLIWFFNDFLSGGRLPMNEMYHFPFIFAGWVGLLVTAINLMPIGQLDGGHISYALFGEKARYISFFTFGLLIVLNFYSLNYLIWTLLIFFIVRFRHPPTLNDFIPLSMKERLLGYLGYLIFILTFVPMPLQIL